MINSPILRFSGLTNEPFKKGAPLATINILLPRNFAWVMRCTKGAPSLPESSTSTSPAKSHSASQAFVSSSSFDFQIERCTSLSPSAWSPSAPTMKERAGANAGFDPVIQLGFLFFRSFSGGSSKTPVGHLPSSPASSLAQGPVNVSCTVGRADARRKNQRQKVSSGICNLRLTYMVARLLAS